ncbi:MAG TPA: calcineurin-like phosphoesterase family protein [Segetibacter sp.]
MVNRRGFLRNFGLAGAAITTPAALVFGATKPGAGKKDLATLTIRGNVNNNGRPLTDVMVTDGINVVATDKQGNYELFSNNTAEFVYISVPAGYTIPHEKGIAKFYVPITQKGSFKADFNLEKLKVDDKKHNFVVWADPQMISEKDATLLKTQSAPDLRDLVKSYPADTLFHGIGCGDLVWDHFDLYEDYKQAVEMTDIPFVNVIGNHDMDIDARTDDFSAQTFKKHFGPTYYSYNRGSVHYVVLDDVFFIGAAKKYIGYLTETQLQWLEQDLVNIKPGSTIVVSLHIPTNTGNARRNNLKEEELGGTLSNRQQLYKILKPYKVHLMSGHTHMNEKWEQDNMIEHVHGTVCGAWWTGPICSEGTPNGYAVYEVNGNDIKWYYKSTGKPKEHQLRIYQKGRQKEFADEVAVNIWNWDLAWKLEWYEDGALKGAMTQRISLDPWAMELYEGADLPKKHKFVDPSLTDHLFYAKPSAGAKEIMVKATDRFGSVFIEKMLLV